jgi:hypothetical protein
VPEFLKTPFQISPAIEPGLVLVRLLVAFALGLVVALVYRFSRPKSETSPTFPTTVVLLAILMTMVTQAIGDSPARAFSLVGALSIVRFRTVLRDTQDTAYVLLAVGIGMAVGANAVWVAVIGLGVSSVAVFTVRARPVTWLRMPFSLKVRLGLGHDMDTILGPAFKEHVARHRLQGLETAKQGISIDATYQLALKSEASAEQLVKALNRLDGIQGVTIERTESDED